MCTHRRRTYILLSSGVLVYSIVWSIDLHCPSPADETEERREWGWVREWGGWGRRGWEAEWKTMSGWEDERDGRYCDSAVCVDPSSSWRERTEGVGVVVKAAGRKERGKWMDRGKERGTREAAWLVSEGSNCAINYRDELSPSTPLQAPRLS